MSYSVVRNRKTGEMMLIPSFTRRRGVIGKKSTIGRKLIKMDGRDYHATKEYRSWL
jgi:hypothetical protein